VVFSIDGFFIHDSDEDEDDLTTALIEVSRHLEACRIVRAAKKRIKLREKRSEARRLGKLLHATGPTGRSAQHVSS